MDDRHWLFISTPWDKSQPLISLGKNNHLMKNPDLEYVNKRKRKKLVQILTSISAIVVGVFVLVSFLGRYTGTFTVALDSGPIKLSLSTKQSFDSQTSYLKLDELPGFDVTTYSSLPPASELDNENTTYTIGIVTDSSERMSLAFFKYTFFVRNGGTVSADYNLKINITRNVLTSDGRDLTAILRVLVYENYNDDDNHQFRIFARKSDTINLTYGYEEGQYTYKEYISYQTPEKASDFGEVFPGFAEMFESESVVATLPTKNFQQGDVKRYTLVVWLEGEDQQTNGNPPDGGNLKLGVTINAYENE